MSRSETFNNVASGISSIFTILGVIGAAVWGFLVFPDLAEARRGWPAHANVQGCLALRPAPALGPTTRYVEAGLSITNGMKKDLLIDSVAFAILRGTTTSSATGTAAYDIEDPHFVIFHSLAQLKNVVKPGTNLAVSGFIVRPEETKYYWRGVMIHDVDSLTPYEFMVQAFMHGDTIPFGFGRPLLIGGPIGKCPWNSSPS